MENARLGELHGAAIAHRALAIAAAARSDWKEAEARMGESIRLARECGARPDLAQSHFRYAELLSRKGDWDAAREQFARAIELFREMEMDWWLEQAHQLERHLES